MGRTSPPCKIGREQAKPVLVPMQLPTRHRLGGADTVASDKPDTLSDIWHGMVPIIFVFDGNVALEMLPSQLVQNSFDVRNTRPENDVGFACSEDWPVL